MRTDPEVCFNRRAEPARPHEDEWDSTWWHTLYKVHEEWLIKNECNAWTKANAIPRFVVEGM